MKLTADTSGLKRLNAVLGGICARLPRCRVRPIALPVLLIALLTSFGGCRTSAKQPVVSLPARHSVKSDQLLILSDVHLDKQHPLFLDLVNLRKQVAESLQLPIQGREVVVYLFGDEPQYRKYINATYPGLPPRRAYFVGTPQELAVFTFWGDRVQEDLRHEFTHGLLHSTLKSVPLWLDEGLAEYFEVVGAETGGMNSDYAERLTTAIVNNWRPNLIRLELLHDIQSMQRVDYQESWAWIHFMLHGEPELRQALLDHLQALKENPDPGPLSKRLYDLQPNLDERFLNYIASLNTFGDLNAAQKSGTKKRSAALSRTSTALQDPGC